MILEINGMQYELSGEKEAGMIGLFTSMLTRMYDSLPAEMQVFVKMGVRKLLKDQEDETRKKVGKEASLKFRPEKKSDPVKHLLSILVPEIQRGFADATVIIDTDGYSISRFFIRQGETGRQVAIDGNIGEWQNNGFKIPGFGVYEALPEHASLGLG